MKLATLGIVTSSSTPITTSSALLDRFYARVLGFMYQVLGDSELAAQATEAVFLRRDLAEDEASVWTAAMAVVRSYLARGFVVRPLVASAQGWQAELLRALARVKPMERALLLLRYHEGLSIELLARVIEIDEQAVRAQIAAARAQLLDAMDTLC